MINTKFFSHFIFLFILCGIGESVHAQTLDEKLEECSKIQVSLIRLQCYDRLTQEPVVTQSAQTTRKKFKLRRKNNQNQATQEVREPSAADEDTDTDQFGSERMTQTDEEADQITSRILGEFKGWSGYTKFQLENGQVWQQSSEGLLIVRINNPTVTIKKSFFGSRVYGFDPTIKKSKIKKIIKTSQKVVKKKVDASTDEIKSANIRIIKNNDQKPEIKKVKTQETEKREYKIKDYVVYPKHGVGQINEFKKINIGGIDVEAYILKFEKDKVSGMVPVNKQSHLRPLATINQINRCISILKGKPKIKRSMWSRRAQEYEAKISSGKIYDLAEVVRDLNKGDDLMIDQSYSERQLFEKAYDRLSTEFQIVLGANLEDAQKKLNKALKRNQEAQAPNVIVKPEVNIEVTPEVIE